MADRELKMNERNFLRSVRKHMVKWLAESAKDHGVKLHASDIDMMQHHIVNTVKWRMNQNEQAASEGHQQGDEPVE